MVSKKSNISKLLGSRTSASESKADDKVRPSRTESSTSVNPAVALATKEREVRAQSERVPVLKLEHDQVRFFKYHDRHISSLEQAKAKKLTKSIEVEGQLFPGVVRKTSDRTSDNRVIYELIAGRLRYESTKRCNVPFKAFLQELTDAEAVKLMFAENEDRLDITPFERWLSIIPIINDDVLSLVDIGELIGWDKANVSRYKKAIPFYETFDLSKELDDVASVKLSAFYDCALLFDKYPEKVEEAISFLKDNYPTLKNNLFLKAISKRVVDKGVSSSETMFLSGSKVRLKLNGDALSINFDGLPKEEELSDVIAKLRELNALK